MRIKEENITGLGRRRGRESGKKKKRDQSNECYADYKRLTREGKARLCC